MAKSRLGVTFVGVGVTEDGNLSVTIPSGATLGVVYYCGWNGSVLNLDNALSDAITVDGENVTYLEGPQAATATLTAQALGQVTGFSTGASKTVAWKQNGAPSEGSHIAIVWYSGAQVKGTSHAIDRWADQQTNGQTLTSANGDEGLIFQQGFNTGTTSAAPASSGQSVIGTATEQQSEQLEVAIEAATGASVSLTGSGSFGSQAAVVIEDEPAGGPGGLGTGSLAKLGVGR